MQAPIERVYLITSPDFITPISPAMFVLLPMNLIITVLNLIDNKITAIPGKRIHLHLKFETVSSLILSCSLNDFTQSPNMNLFSQTFLSFLILKLFAGEQLYLVTNIKDPSKR